MSGADRRASDSTVHEKQRFMTESLGSPRAVSSSYNEIALQSTSRLRTCEGLIFVRQLRAAFLCSSNGTLCDWSVGHASTIE